MKTYLVEIRRDAGCMFITRIKKPKCYDPVEVCENKIIYILDAKNAVEAGEKAERIYKGAEKYLPILRKIIEENPQEYIEAMREAVSANFGGVLQKIREEMGGEK